MLEQGSIIFGECEQLSYAPFPHLAERRLGFYARYGAKFAGYEELNHKHWLPATANLTIIFTGFRCRISFRISAATFTATIWRSQA